MPTEASVEVHFIFSDEAGVYQPDPSRSSLRAHPYYCRAAVGVSASDWVALRELFEAEVGRLGVPPEQELKWAYIQSIIQHRVRGEAIPIRRDYSWCSAYSNEQLIGFVRQSLSFLRDAPSSWAVLTFTSSIPFQKWTTDQMLLWHVQELMQRTEMHLRPGNNLGVFFLDPTSDGARDRRLREAYAELYRNGDFIEEYRHVKDSLAFEVSHHSFGVWLADYVAGIFNGWLKGYRTSTELFADLVWPILRKDGRGRAEGWGIREVPSSHDLRKRLRERCANRAVAERF
ncbi:DUF3800 domain-containing protein [Thioalkalivibrio sp.]|uniref:DUF3800 domain-containing protein n=1 Tax=Thioalkalivibrio sp. TaxID=2093813 RepID=UPI00356282F5